MVGVRPGWRWVLWAGGLLLLGTLAAPVTAGTETTRVCLLCRATRTERDGCGIRISCREEADAFATWFRAGHAEHACVWTRGSGRFLNLWGRASGWSCSLRHPLLGVPKEWERAFLEKADSERVRIFWEGVLSSDRKEQERAAKEVADWALATQEGAQE